MRSLFYYYSINLNEGVDEWMGYREWGGGKREEEEDVSVEF